MALRVGITDLAGEVKTWLTEFSDLSVEVPLNESRTANVTMSIYDEAFQHVSCGDRMLKVVYNEHLIFIGRIVIPRTSARDAICELSCIDNTILLKHHYHRFGDPAVDQGFTWDGAGLVTLIQSAHPIAAHLTEGTPDIGILAGYDTTTPQTLWGTGDDDYWSYAQRGSEVWESMTKLCNVAEIGPDMEFQPIDDDHNPLGLVRGQWDHWMINAYDKQGDADNTATFVLGYGADNLDDFTHEPDFDQCRTYATYVRPGGETGSTDYNGRRTYDDHDSRIKYGLMGTWESGEDKDGPKELRSKAKALVKGYAYPPDYFTLSPMLSGENTLAYLDDYKVGDEVNVKIQRGYFQSDFRGRVVAVRVLQEDAAGNDRIEVDCVPNVPGVATETNP